MIDMDVYGKSNRWNGPWKSVGFFKSAQQQEPVSLELWAAQLRSQEEWSASAAEV